MRMLSENQIEEWRDTGGLLVSGLFSASEVMSLAGHFEAMRKKFVESSKKPLRDEEYEEGDPLIEYQRIDCQCHSNSRHAK